jgi:hypothetical protein
LPASHRGGPGSNPGLVMWDFVMDKSGAGARFLRELRFPLPIYIPSASPQSSSLSPEAGTIGQEWRPGFNPGSGHVRFCNGQKWRWGTFSPRTSVSPVNLHSICVSTIIFTITRGLHNRPGVAAVPIASQTRIKKKLFLLHLS